MVEYLAEGPDGWNGSGQSVELGKLVKYLLNTTGGILLGFGPIFSVRFIAEIGPQEIPRPVDQGSPGASPIAL